MKKLSIECLNFHQDNNQKIQEIISKDNRHSADIKICYNIRIDDQFGIEFYDSSRIDFQFIFRNCTMDLGNLLFYFSQMGCKRINIKVDNLEYQYTHNEDQNLSKYHSKGKDVLSSFISQLTVKEGITSR